MPIRIFVSVVPSWLKRSRRQCQGDAWIGSRADGFVDDCEAFSLRRPYPRDPFFELLCSRRGCRRRGDRAITFSDLRSRRTSNACPGNAATHERKRGRPSWSDHLVAVALLVPTRTLRLPRPNLFGFAGFVARVCQDRAPVSYRA